MRKRTGGERVDRSQKPGKGLRRTSGSGPFKLHNLRWTDLWLLRAKWCWKVHHNEHNDRLHRCDRRRCADQWAQHTGGTGGSKKMHWLPAGASASVCGYDRHGTA